MAKPNYSFEKRQRELAKKKKQEEKAAKKAREKAGDAPHEGEAEPANVPQAPGAD
jgi:hypothetical protein